MDSITTSGGTTISLRDEPLNAAQKILGYEAGKLVIFSHPDAPEGMREIEVGRIIRGFFQPASYADWGMSPETLRALADFVEQQKA
jgi:hypothetical protein